MYKLDSITAAKIDTSEENAMLDAVAMQQLKGTEEFLAAVMLPADHPRGRKHIRITEWGPYDFRYPLVWRTNPLDTSGLLKFDVLGPEGTWKLTGSKGVESISKSGGSFPDSLTARRKRNYKGEILIELEYDGQQITTQFGEKAPAGKPFRFAFRDARVPMQWDMKWFAFDSAKNPVNDVALVNGLQQGKPFVTRRVNDLNFAWWGGISAGSQKATQFLTVAESTVTLEPGEYELAVTWDDAVRVMLDGKYILNEWNPSLYKFDESPNKRLKLKLGGRHTFKVEHAELGGFATISFKLKKL